jgi:hypothetical protein
VRSEIDRLDHLADRALFDEVARMHGRAHFEALRIHDRELLLRFPHGLAHGHELLERRDAGLVDEHVLAGFHRADRERRAQIRNRRAQDELDRLVVQDLVFAGSELHVAELLAEVFQLLRVRRVHRHELAAAALDGRGHAEDVRVVHADHGETDRVRGFRRRLRISRLDGERAALREGTRSHGRHHTGQPGAAQEFATIFTLH